jgi:hypothetical protein
MQVSQLNVNASIRFLCDKYHRGEFGQATTSRPAPKITSEYIKINHTQHTVYVVTLLLVLKSGILLVKLNKLLKKIYLIKNFYFLLHLLV